MKCHATELKPLEAGAVGRSHAPGLTLVELLVTMCVMAVLATVVFGGYRTFVSLATRANCSSNLRQLGSAVHLYVSDNGGFFPPYVKNNRDGSREWYFGKEPYQPGTSEGDRELDREAGPLYPYIQTVGSVEVCKGFNYGAAIWKAKFKGASYGYGYNWALGGRMTGRCMNISALRNGSSVILMGDCGQVNTFQAPASPGKPMIEEFYIINESYKTIHFRHANRANILFVDGHVESMEAFPGTEDRRVKGELLGRVTKAGSTEMLK
ncbi:H-X9-DG-CTERM domain-containing protein [Roseimicrobium sp. ORNL1]|uniref:prepilin-type N-terminal cleavage/methylation domain-containing protein n=1 Tax=Roseimicrobium sp. ORNL1 TaxID=2711231 RepID=UPI0013E1146B|nr:H-X9-DG-CTERM domain-containing protein [Roseimicrobium sp. ORNL1]QIF03518.1 prepilin-type N-terminal cleavage/methylation domain-containing protein [Roseimicrobium sp. ORNL1]